MNIIVDISPLSSQPITGIGQILENLIAEFRRREDVDLSCFTITARGYLPELKKRYPELKAPSIPARLSKKALRLATLISFPIDLFTGPADAVISIDWLCLPLLSGKTVAIVTDATPLTNPEWHKTETITLFTRRIRKIERNADFVVAISQATKREVVEVTDIPEEDIIVAYPGISRSFKKKPTNALVSRVKRKYKLPKEYLLSVGTREPRKNLETLMDVYASLDAKQERKTRLILVGDKGWGRALKIPAFVRTFDFVPDRELPVIYALSKGLVYPSLKEGFGLPIVEAFAMGVPVLTSNTSSMKEIAESAAILVDPYSAADIRRGLEEILTMSDERRKKLIAMGKKHLKKFSYEKMADKIIQEIKSRQ